MTTQERALSAALPFWQRKGLRKFIGPKRALLSLGFLACLIALWQLRSQGLMEPKLVFAFIKANPLSAPAIFVAFYALFSFFLVPTLPLNLGAGLLWGSLGGACLASLGGWCGACAAFLIIRTALGQPLAKRFNHRMARTLQDSLDQSGWRVVAFTRINPIFPSGPLNFLLGLTSLSFFDYAWSTLVFQFPPTLAFAILGAQTTDLVVDGQTSGLTQKIMLASLGISLIFISRYAIRLVFDSKKAERLRNEVTLQEEDS